MAEWPKRPRLKGNRVEEHDGEIRFQTGSGNIAYSFMRHASGHIIIGTVRSLWTWLWGRYHVTADTTFHRTYF